MKNNQNFEIKGEFDPKYCFQIFRKEGKVVLISFDREESETFAKNKDAYDEIYWCLNYPTAYDKYGFVDIT